MLVIAASKTAMLLSAVNRRSVREGWVGEGVALLADLAEELRVAGHQVAVLVVGGRQPQEAQSRRLRIVFASCVAGSCSGVAFSGAGAAAVVVTTTGSGGT